MGSNKALLIQATCLCSLHVPFCDSPFKLCASQGMQKKPKTCSLRENVLLRLCVVAGCSRLRRFLVQPETTLTLQFPYPTRSTTSIGACNTVNIESHSDNAMFILAWNTITRSLGVDLTRSDFAALKRTSNSKAIIYR